jgi:spore germination cell wall hydrolase CwlJ-like protein
MNASLFAKIFILLFGLLFVILFFSDILINDTPYVQTSNKPNEKLIEAIARVINKECSYCPVTDKILIGSSIINRMNHPDFPCEYEDVIENQYAISDTFDLQSYKIAELIVINNIKDNNVLYFYNPKIATDKKFMRLMESHDLITKTKYHNYYN